MLEYESPHIQSAMASRVVIKLGGGLITDKGSMKKFDSDSVERIADSISSIVEMGVPVIVVHGAGSFGHLLAKEWSISEGSTPSDIDHSFASKWPKDPAP